jgi:hypothetical protein
MKKYELVLKNNEELIVDCDDLMEQEMVEFAELTKVVEESDLTLFDNWVGLYKVLNYDIMEEITIDKVYKFNPNCAVIELTFRGEKEFDFLSFNPEDMTVSCMNQKGDAVRKYIVRRLLVPQTAEEALSFAKSEMSQEAIEKLAVTIEELKTKGDVYEVQLNTTFTKVKTEETKTEENVEETKTEENVEEINQDEEFDNEEEYEEIGRLAALKANVTGIFSLSKQLSKAKKEIRQYKKENKKLQEELIVEKRESKRDYIIARSISENICDLEKKHLI